jgi:hypothetical protein
MEDYFDRREVSGDGDNIDADTGVDDCLVPSIDGNISDAAPTDITGNDNFCETFS